MRVGCVRGMSEGGVWGREWRKKVGCGGEGMYVH